MITNVIRGRNPLCKTEILCTKRKLTNRANNALVAKDTLTRETV